jgi:hypothetical protein
VLPPDVSDSVEKQLIICSSELRLGLKLTAPRPVLDGREYCVNLNGDARSRWNRNRNSNRRVSTADLAAAAVARIAHQVNVGMQAVVARHDYASEIEKQNSRQGSTADRDAAPVEPG